jgi:hypothetical protein
MGDLRHAIVQMQLVISSNSHNKDKNKNIENEKLKLKNNKIKKNSKIKKTEKNVFIDDKNDDIDSTHNSSRVGKILFFTFITI